MAKVLTARGVEGLKPDPARRLEIADGGLQGLYHVLQPSGSRSWALRYRAGGKPRKLTLGAYPALSLADAREEARKALRAVQLGADPAAEKQAAKIERAARDIDTVAALVDLFHARHASKRRTGDEQLKLLHREIMPLWGDRRADSITRRDVVDLL
ncbi:MAG: integrase arm-type DNA-binding domain-containing protein, partial [Rubrimonas sp.]